MIIVLNKLHIENFKGVKAFTLDLAGESVNGYGANGTGKSTLFDAFQWVLFDKNGEGNSKFGIKPNNLDGTEKHYLETLVELELLVDGKPLTLKKVYKEKWTKKNGETEKEFTGHETSYYVNDTPKSMKDYKTAINELANEDTFKMLTNVYCFNESDWKAQRKLILSLCPNLSHEEVIKHNPELTPLRVELERKSLDDIQLTYKSQKNDFNKKLATIPARIDELKKIDYSSVDGLTVDGLKVQIEMMNKKQQEINVKKLEGNNQSEVINLESQIQMFQVQRAQLSNFTSTKAERLDKLTAEGRKLRAEKAELELKLQRLENQKKDAIALKASRESLRDKLYVDYDNEQAKQFTAGTCSYCGQALPQDKVDEMQKQFNSKKVETINNIIANGKQMAASIVESEATIKNCDDELVVVKEQVLVLDKQISDKLKEYQEVNSEIEVNPNQSKLDALVRDMQNLQERIYTLKSNVNANPYEAEENQIKTEVFELNCKIALINQKEASEMRVKELADEEKKASSDLSNANYMLTLCDKYLVAKAELLEDTINNHFTMVKFKMFEKQVNGGIAETCVATIDGVSFGDLNTAKKVNGGLDIIKALQNIYGIKAPIFIDNAESVTNYMDLPDTQFIKLYVSKSDKQLRFE